MKRDEFLQMMVQDNETQPDAGKKQLYSDVIDCMELALSQCPADTEIDAGKNIEEAFRRIKAEGTSNASRSVGPFRAAELIAQYLGVTYERAVKKFAKKRIDFDPTSLV